MGGALNSSQGSRKQGPRWVKGDFLPPDQTEENQVGAGLSSQCCHLSLQSSPAVPSHRSTAALLTLPQSLGYSPITVSSVAVTLSPHRHLLLSYFLHHPPVPVHCHLSLSHCHTVHVTLSTPTLLSSWRGTLECLSHSSSIRSPRAPSPDFLCLSRVPSCRQNSTVCVQGQKIPNCPLAWS